MMDEALRYIGDSVDLSYEITETPNPLHQMIGVSVSVFNEEGQIVYEDPVQIVDNVVKYVVNPEMTKHRGNYVAHFTHRFSNNLTKTHSVFFPILPRGIPAETLNTPVMDLTEESTPNEVEHAVGSTLRWLRRRGVEQEQNKDVTYDTAQLKTKKRIKG